MRIDYAKAGDGKTTRLVEWARENIANRYIITFSKREEARLKEQYPDIGFHVIHWETYLASRRMGGYTGGHAQYAIDNADYILDHIFQQYIHIATFTKETVEMRSEIDKQAKMATLPKNKKEKS